VSIAKLSKVGAYGLMGFFIAALALASLGVNQIKLGGPLHSQNRELSAFNADLSPPPISLVEAFALANEMAINPKNFQIDEGRLGVLERQMQERADFWANSDIREDLKAELASAASTDTAEFWNVINNELKPAIRSGNQGRIDQALNRLLTSYSGHRAQIDGLVQATSAAQTELSADSAATVNLVTIALIALALCLAGALVWASTLLSKRVFTPLANTAETMKRMASGDFNVGRRASDRADEIGAMFDALQVFRQSLETNREREAKQLQLVETLSGALEKLAAGDLTARITEHFDETNEKVRDAFNTSIERLARLMSDVRGSAQSVSAGSNEIRTASDDLSMRNTQQAASLEETAAAMSAVTQLVKKSADNARVAQTSIAETHEQASSGGQVVKKAVAAMASIEDSSTQITQIIDVIDGIAFQTNLLALNAGVEAARAGEAGKGFAVVANEVRALAQRSADAARDIKQLIGTSTGQVNEGVNLVGETGQVLDAIVQQIGTVTAQVQEIAETAVTQSENLDQVNSSVSIMDQTTQQNAAMVEQTNAASRSLSDEAAQLTQLVARFRVSQLDAEPIAQTAMAPKAAKRAPKPPLEPARMAVPAKPKAPSPKPKPKPRPHPQGEVLSMGNLAVKAPPPQAAPAPVPVGDPLDDDQDWSEF